MVNKSVLTLRITGPDGSVNEARSEQESIILGSGAGAAVRLADPRVSNLHVLLKREPDGRVMAIDLGSEHGTLLDGNRVLTDPTSLTDGDVLQVGESRVRVLFGSAGLAPIQHPPGAVAIGHGGAALELPVSEPVHAPKPAEPALRAVPSPARARRPLDPAKVAFTGPLPEGAAPTATERVLELCVFWGDTAVDVRHFRDGEPLRVGPDKGASVALHTVPGADNQTLAVLSGAGSHLTLPQGARAQLRSAGGTISELGAGAHALGLEERARVELGGLTLVLRHVRRAERVKGALFPASDYTFAKLAAVALLIFLALVTAMALTPRVERAAIDPLIAPPQHYTRMLVKPARKLALEQLTLKGGQEEGARAEGEEGKFGKPEATQEQAAPSKPGAPIVDRSKTEADRKKVMRSGLLGALGGGSAASNVLGPGGVGTGINDALGGLKAGGPMGDAHGTGGLGARGGSNGGGGEGLGLGGLGTQGRGTGAGGSGGLDLAGRGKQVTRIIPGKTTAVGGLDKEVIAAVIRRHANEIKFCYEKELQKDPSLGGKVTVDWTIDPSGAVVEALVQESTLANAQVEGCIISRIQRWRFPEEKNGSSTQVNFPWVFKPAGDDA